MLPHYFKQFHHNIQLLNIYQGVQITYFSGQKDVLLRRATLKKLNLWLLSIGVASKNNSKGNDVTNNKTFYPFPTQNNKKCPNYCFEKTPLKTRLMLPIKN